MKEVTFHPAPVWLTKEYVERVLRNYKSDNGLSIKKLEIRPATAKGDNYASIMTRVKVEYLPGESQTLQQDSYIVKTSYENDPFVSDIMKPYDLYNTEMLMYEKVLPQLSALLQETGDGDKLFANTVHVDYEHSAIIFEDLAVLDYTVSDRLRGMDECHAKLALKKLAKMHATAAVLNERLPGVLTKLDHGMVNRHTAGFGPFFENMFEECANFAGECQELGKYYKEKLLKLKPYVMEYAARCYDSQPHFFNTLIHGDFWVNNIMLRYSTENQKNGTRSVKDILLIDFQFCNWSSPAIDLHYFFNTSLQDDLQRERQDELVQYFYYVLADTLQRLNFHGQIPSLHEFCIQIEAGRFCAVTAALVQQPVMINDKTEDADFHTLMGTDERSLNFRKLLYKNIKIQKYMKAVLPYFDRKGLLDVSYHNQTTFIK